MKPYILRYNFGKKQGEDGRLNLRLKTKEEAEEYIQREPPAFWDSSRILLSIKLMVIGEGTYHVWGKSEE